MHDPPVHHPAGTRSLRSRLRRVGHPLTGHTGGGLSRPPDHTPGHAPGDLTGAKRVAQCDPDADANPRRPSMRPDVNAGARFSRLRADRPHGRSPRASKATRPHDSRSREPTTAQGASATTRLPRRISKRPSAPQWAFGSDSGCLVQLDLELQEDTDPENDPLIPHARPSDVRRWPISRTTCRMPALKVSPAENSAARAPRRDVAWLGVAVRRLGEARRGR